MYKRIFAAVVALIIMSNISVIAQVCEAEGVYTEDFEDYTSGDDIMTDKTIIKEYTKFAPELDEVSGSQVMRITSASGTDNIIYTNTGLFDNELNVIRFKIGADSAKQINWGSGSSLVFSHTNSSGVMVNDYILDFAYNLVRHRENGVTEKGLSAFTSKKLYDVEVETVKTERDDKYYYDVTYKVNGTYNTISYETADESKMRIGFKSTSGNNLYVDDIEAYGYTLVRSVVNIENRNDVSVIPEITMTFSDEIDIDTLSAGTMLADSVTVKDIEEIDTNKFRITLSSPLKKNTEYAFDMSGVRDMNGNALKNTEFHFKTKDSSVVLERDNVVNTSLSESEDIAIVLPEYENGRMKDKTVLDVEIQPEEEISVGVDCVLVLTSDHRPIDSSVFVEGTGKTDDKFSAGFDSQGQTLYASGKTETGVGGELMSVYVTDPSGEIDYIGVTRTDERGYFGFEYAPSSVSGIYNISLQTMQEKFSSDVAVRASSDITELLDVVNSKDKTTIEAAFTKYADVLSIGLDLYDAISDKSFIAEELVACVEKNGSYRTVEKLVEDIKALSLICTIKDSADALAVFGNYEELLLSPDDAAYTVWSGLSDDAKETVLENVLSSGAFVPETFSHELYVAAILKMTADTNKYIDVKNMIEQYYELLDLNITEYNKLDKPSSVAKGLCGKQWTLEGFKAEFYSLVKKASQNGEKYNSSGSGGGSYTIPVAETKPTSAPTPQHEPASATPAAARAGFEFSDMAEAAWAEESVYYLYKNGILNGYDDGTFRPNDEITREEFATVIVRYLGLDVDTECDFIDVRKNDWFYGYIAAAKKEGIISGITDTEFGTGRIITRQDASLMLYNIGDIPEIKEFELTFSDVSQISDYAESAIKTLSYAGIIDGNPDGSFVPLGSLTRAQAAKLIYAYDKAKKDGYSSGSESAPTSQNQYPAIETGLLRGLGIITDELPDSGELVPRGEFAKYLVRFMGSDELSSVFDDSYEDVTKYTEHADAIYCLRSKNILNDSGTKFFPDRIITGREAAVAVAKALGYGSVPGPIEEHAASLGIYGLNDSGVTYKDLISGFYKALRSKCVIVDYNSVSHSYELKDDYLSVNFGVQKDKGIMRSNSITTIDGTGTAYKDKAVISNRSLINKAGDIDDMLGMQVDYYYIEEGWHRNDEDNDVLICAVPTSVNIVTSILARDIVSFDGRTLAYYKDNKSENLIIKSNIDVIYNGVACPDYELAMLSPTAGRITHIDNGSGVDCVKVESYIDRIVTASTDEYIYFKGDVKLELDNFADNGLFIYDKFNNDADSIPDDSVLSLFYSKNKDILRAVYSTDTVENIKIQNVSDDYIIANGQTYYVNGLYDNWKSDIGDMSSAQYKLYLDAFGEVARIEKSSGGKAFGYLISAYDDESGEGKWIKMLVENGEIEKLECSTNIRVNGSKISSQSLEDGLRGDNGISQLITYRLNNENKVSEINTAANRDTYNGSIEDLNLNAFKISYRSEPAEYYKSATTVFGVSCPVDEFTKVFFVADNPQSATDDYYWTGGISYLSNDDRAKNGTVGYMTTSRLGNAEAMVVYGAGSGGTIGKETRISVVTDIKQVINDDGEERKRVTFITSGKLVAYNISPDLDIAEYNLSKGDLVRFAIDRRYEVSALDMIGDLKENGDVALKYSGNSGYQNTSDAGGAVFRIVSGSVYDYDNGLLCISRGDVNGIDTDAPNFEYYRIDSGVFTCVVDGDKVNIGSALDMTKYVDDKTGYSGIFLTTRYGAVRDIVIYK